MTQKLSLTELQLIIRDSLYLAFPDMYWVIAEISEIKENYAGHCYLELIEKNPDEKNIRSRIRAIIWCKTYRFLKSFFENITGESLKEGLKVLVKIKVEYHELYGLSLIICDIDPAFTVGELAMKRQLIIRKLEQEGIFTMNREMDFPSLPQKIAVISSANTAGYTDFMNHLNGNSYGYIYYTKLFESPMQGQETEMGITGVLDRIAGHYELFDLVVIIRGGGSQYDLSWFDNYNIAYHVTQFPLPVITGIGHEKDMSVTDLVANMALKTPTAVADYIIDRTATAESRIMGIWASIMDLSRIIIDKNSRLIESSAIKLLPLSRILIAKMKDKLSEKTFRIMNIGKYYTRRAETIHVNHLSGLISATRSFLNGKESLLEKSGNKLHPATLNQIKMVKLKLQVLEKNLEILKPENVLKRGYTITSLNGIIVKSCNDLRYDDLIDTKFRNGIIRSKIIEKGNKDD